MSQMSSESTALGSSTHTGSVWSRFWHILLFTVGLSQESAESAALAGPVDTGSVWSRLWQVPLFLVGLGLFLYGLRAFQETRPVIPFATHRGDIQNLIAGGHFAPALKQIANIQEFYGQKLQQAQLELLAGDAFYLAQQEQPGVVAANYQSALKHYDKALAWGTSATPALDERRGLSFLALGQYPEAIFKIEPLVKPHPAERVELARSLIKAYLGAQPPYEARALEILAGLATAPAVDDRVWAMVMRLYLSKGHSEAGNVIVQAIAAADSIKENLPNGVLRVAIGQALFEAGRLDEAQTQLLLARKQYEVVGHRLEDGRAALLLGRIAQSRAMETDPAKRPELLDQAAALYQRVITTHAGSILMPAAHLGRAEISAYSGHPDDTMLSDYKSVIKALTPAKESEGGAGGGVGGGAGGGYELISPEAVRASLLHQYGIYQEAGRHEEAQRFLELAHQLPNLDAAGMAYRDAKTQESLADDELQTYRTLAPTDPGRNAVMERMLGHLRNSAEAYYQYSHLSALHDTEAAQSLWKAAQLFDRAGLSRRAITAYTEFARQWPREFRVPEALHTVGLLHQSRGEFDEAIACYQRNIQANPKTPASYLSSVQLARCYMAQGTAQFPKAEQVLLGLVQNNRDIAPTANEFRISLFTLGELYYRTARWSDAILRLEEACLRYPKDTQVPRAVYYLADAYRNSAAELTAALKQDPQIAQRDQLERARQERLARAGALFEQVVNLLDPDNDGGNKPGPTGLDEEYVRNSYLYRADCQYDLGQYPAAIKLYELTAARFTSSLTAIQAYVQVVNSYVALKQNGQARAAAERARWMLQRMPDEAFGQPPLALSRKYYADLLDMRKFGP